MYSSTELNQEMAPYGYRKMAASYMKLPISICIFEFNFFRNTAKGETEAVNPKILRLIQIGIYIFPLFFVINQNFQFSEFQGTKKISFLPHCSQCIFITFTFFLACKRRLGSSSNLLGCVNTDSKMALKFITSF